MAHAAFGAKDLHILRTQADYDTALVELSQLMKTQPAPGSAAANRLELLALLAEDYESRTVKLAETTPQDVVEFMADQHGLSRGELADLMGGRSHLSYFMKGRALSKSQMSRLSERLGIPIALLFDQSSARPSSARKAGRTRLTSAVAAAAGKSRDSASGRGKPRGFHSR